MPNPPLNLNDSLLPGVFPSEQPTPIGFGTVTSKRVLIASQEETSWLT